MTVPAALCRADGLELGQVLAASEMIRAHCHGTLALQPVRRRVYRLRRERLPLVRPAEGVTLVEGSYRSAGPWTELAAAAWDYTPGTAELDLDHIGGIPWIRVTTENDGFGRYEPYMVGARGAATVSASAAEEGDSSLRVTIAGGVPPADVKVVAGDVIAVGGGLVLAREGNALDAEGDVVLWVDFDVDGSPFPALGRPQPLQRWVPPAPLEDACSTLAARIAIRDRRAGQSTSGPDGVFQALFSDLRRQISPFVARRTP